MIVGPGRGSQGRVQQDTRGIRSPRSPAVARMGPAPLHAHPPPRQPWSPPWGSGRGRQGTGEHSKGGWG